MTSDKAEMIIIIIIIKKDETPNYHATTLDCIASDSSLTQSLKSESN